MENIQLRVKAGPSGNVAGFAGLQTCGSVWACPVCSAKVLSRRQSEISQAVETWRSRGGRVAMATFTVRHEATDCLEEVWDGISAGWHAVTAGREWQNVKRAWGVGRSGVPLEVCPVGCCGEVVHCDAASCGADSPRGRRHQLVCKDGQPTKRASRHAGNCRLGWDQDGYLLPWVRVAEVTVGDAFGWHVHTHVLLFLPGEMTPGQLVRLYDSMWTRWADGAAAAGLDGCLRVNEVEFFDGAAADALAPYVTKNTYSAGDRLGLEMARGDLKGGRRGNRSAFQVLRDVVAPGEDLARVPADAALWATFEQGSRGRRQMLWAHGARALLGLDVELTDEEVAAEELGTSADAVLELPFDTWSAISRTAGRRAQLLEVAEDAGFDGAAALLDVWHLTYFSHRQRRYRDLMPFSEW